MGRKGRIAVILLVAAAAAVLWVTRRQKPDEGLVLSGTIEARHAEVGSLLGGRVAVVHAEEGASVAAGAPLVGLETDLIGLQVREQQARLAETRAVAARAVSGPRKEAILRAQTEAEHARRERDRLRELLGRGIIARQLFDDAEARARTTSETYQELLRGNRDEDVQAAAAAVEREQARLAYLERQFAETVVRSPAAGVVETLDLRPGDLVAAGQPVASILESGQLWVRVFVPEPKLALVRLGQKAKVRIDGSDREFPGTIAEIRQRAEYTPRNVQTLDQRSEQVFGVKVTIAPAPELKPGMAAFVRLF